MGKSYFDDGSSRSVKPVTKDNLVILVRELLWETKIQNILIQTGCREYELIDSSLADIANLINNEGYKVYGIIHLPVIKDLPTSFAASHTSRLLLIK